eukprot:278556_1
MKQFDGRRDMKYTPASASISTPQPKPTITQIGGGYSKAQRFVKCKMKNYPCRSHNHPTCISCKRHKLPLKDTLMNCNYHGAWANFLPHTTNWHPNQDPNDEDNYSITGYQEKRRQRDKKKSLQIDSKQSHKITNFGVNISASLHPKPSSSKTIAPKSNPTSKKKRQSTLNFVVSKIDHEDQKEESINLNNSMDIVQEEYKDNVSDMHIDNEFNDILDDENESKEVR